MNRKGLELEIPGWGCVRLLQALFDLNGTLALDGMLSEGVQERLRRLQRVLGVYVITADTHGTVARVMQDCGDLQIMRIEPGNEACQKRCFVEKLGASQTVALGNGANDALMLRKACLGICVMHGEGTALQALLASEVLVRSAEEALDLLLQPTRLVATLRS
ncbi:MAG: HAD family hydrolase [Syntrophobacteria bacterium]